MFVGHLAVALGSKRAVPEVPLGAAVAAAFGLDLLWPVLLLAGAETVRVRAHDTAFTNLAFDSYPWSHSLAMAAVWSVVTGVIATRLLRSRRAGLVLGALVASHWVLDWVTHRPDLPLWPGGPLVGLGLWNSVPGTFVVEGSLLAGCAAVYAVSTPARDRVGTLGFAGLVGFCLLLWGSGPWAPLPPGPTAVAWGSLILYVLPPWATWIDRHRDRAATDVGHRPADGDR